MGLQNRILLHPTYLEIKFRFFKFHLWILQMAKFGDPISQNLPCGIAHIAGRPHQNIWQSSASNIIIQIRTQKINLHDELYMVVPFSDESEIRRSVNTALEV